MENLRTTICIAFCLATVFGGAASPSIAATEEGVPRYEFAASEEETLRYQFCGAKWISNINSLRDFENRVPIEQSIRPNSNMLYRLMQTYGALAAYNEVEQEYRKCAGKVREANYDETSDFRQCSFMSAVLTETIKLIEEGAQLQDIHGSSPQEFLREVTAVANFHGQGTLEQTMKFAANKVEECLNEMFSR
jgi:hypothetical protein